MILEYKITKPINGKVILDDEKGEAYLIDENDIPIYKFTGVYKISSPEDGFQEFDASKATPGIKVKFNGNAYPKLDDACISRFDKMKEAIQK